MFAPQTAGAQEKALLKRPGSSRPARGKRFGSVLFGRQQAGPQAQCGGRLSPLAARRSTSFWGLRASGGPQASPSHLPGRTLWVGWICLVLWGGGGSSSSDTTLGTVGSRAGHGAPLETFHLVGLFQKNLTQDDPHRGVSLDGEAQCFQGPKGRIHFPLGHTLVEGANLEVTIRAPRVPESG